MKNLFQAVIVLSLFSTYAQAADSHHKCAEELSYASKGEAQKVSKKFFNKLKAKMTKKGFKILENANKEPGTLEIKEFTLESLDLEIDGLYNTGALIDVVANFSAITADGVQLIGETSGYISVKGKEVFKAGVAQNKIECTYDKLNPVYVFTNPETGKRVSSRFHRPSNHLTDALNVIGLRDHEGLSFKTVIPK